MKLLLSILFFLFITQTVIAQTYKEEITAYREKYKQDFLEEERSPLKKEDIQFLRFYDADEMYRVKATFRKTENAEAFDMATLNGKTKKYIEYGTLSFMLSEKKLSLKIYQSITLMDNPEYKDHLFLPFNDETNGNETYMNGRYLDCSIGDILNNELVLDFNKAYNPFCAFSDGYSCPKPPEENNLSIAINAGEKNFAKSKH